MELPSLVDTDLKFFKIQDRNYVLDIPSSTLFEINSKLKPILEKSVHQKSLSYLEEMENEFNFLDWVEIIGELKYMIDHRHITIHSSNIIPYSLKEQNVNSITLHLSHDCNMECAYCYQKSGTFKKETEYMSKEVAYKSIEFLFKNSLDHQIQLNISGGEPLLNEDLVSFIIQIARENEEKYEKDLKIALLTNGTLLNKKILSDLVDNQVELIIHLSELKNHNLSQERLEWIKESGIDYQIKGIIHSNNLIYLPEVLAKYEMEQYSLIWLDLIGAKPETEFAFNSEDLELLKEYIDQLFDRYRRQDPFIHRLGHVCLAMDCIVNKKNYGYSCGAGKNYLCIVPSGDIYPCHLLVGQELFRLGNVVENTFDQESRKAFYEPLHVLNRENCSECWARYMCGGGCVGENYFISKNLKEHYLPRCKITNYMLYKAVETYCFTLTDDEKLTLKHERRKKGREIYKIS